MRFRQQQEQARTATGGLLALFALTVLFTVVGVNLALALAWRLQFGWLAGYPLGFFEVNTAVTLGFVLGGAWLESVRLRDGGAHVATLIGGHEVATSGNPGERRLRNVVDEMAIATGLKSPRVFVLDREQAINALAAGWEPQDSVIAVTRGALDRLTRAELQGVVAHEFAHILNGDTRLNMRLIGMVFGLQMVSNLGRMMMEPGDDGRRGPAALIGLALVAAGSIGWLAGRLLKAGVSRQREYLADAYAVQFTREPTGIGDALRKIDTQLRRGERLQHVNAEVVSHLLLSSDTLLKAGALATHPSIAERLRRIFGHSMDPLPDDVLAVTQDKPPELPPLDFQVIPVGGDEPLRCCRRRCWPVPSPMWMALPRRRSCCGCRCFHRPSSRPRSWPASCRRMGVPKPKRRHGAGGRATPPGRSSCCKPCGLCRPASASPGSSACWIARTRFRPSKSWN